MSLQELPSGERAHIALFGIRNAGKSSLANALTGQELSVVSEVKGTTTDPVRRAMEILPLGPVVIIDTPGIDDEGILGDKRSARARTILDETDLALLVTQAGTELCEAETALLKAFSERKLPYIIVRSKAELAPVPAEPGEGEIYVSAKTGFNIHELKERIGRLLPQKREKKLLLDLIPEGGHVILVTPIDASAPKGRLILPQQQTLRELLDGHHPVTLCQVEELEQAFKGLKESPALVVTDSQAFGEVAKILPENVPLTSFSILFARYKGELELLVRGAEKLLHLKAGERVLIAEGCTHHRQCGDIGSVKLPAWIREYTGIEPEISLSSGHDFPEDLSPYSLILHCGGCMLGETEMKSRIARAAQAKIPMVNYGVAIAAMKGILERSLKPLSLSPGA